MNKTFTPEELDEMQVDWQRTHNVKIVAELHGCTQPEVMQALGLDPAKYAKSGEKPPGRSRCVLCAGGRRHEH